MTGQRFLYDILRVSDTLTIRLSAAEKARWQAKAKDAGETVAEFVRTAVRQRADADPQARWEKHVGSVDCPVPKRITNAAIRLAMQGSKR